MTYQLTKNDTIRRLADDAFIPKDPRNRDYQAYLEWLKEGNTPQPAPPVPTIPVLTTEQRLQELGLNIADLRRLLAPVQPNQQP